MLTDDRENKCMAALGWREVCIRLGSNGPYDSLIVSVSCLPQVLDGGVYVEGEYTCGLNKGKGQGVVHPLLW